VEAIHAAREGLAADLAGRLREDFMAAYEASREPPEFSLEIRAMGRRRFRNGVLGYLSRISDDDNVRKLCVAQYQSAHNMTDSLAALACVAHSDWPERGELLQHFHDRWKGEPLVLDKWFSLQATSVRTDTLQQVKALMDHPAFSLSNPNRVRALVGGFVAANPVRFHAEGGEGYDFLASQVLALDALNPQIAARLLRVMSRWRRYDSGRQALMREALARVLAHDGLSKDSFEVASKSLGDT
ncbi:MAG: aminopeptidase N C-terminal domain-containing protein, partial [Pseudomonadota bacterium]